MPFRILVSKYVLVIVFELIKGEKNILLGRYTKKKMASFSSNLQLLCPDYRAVRIHTVNCLAGQMYIRVLICIALHAGIAPGKK